MEIGAQKAGVRTLEPAFLSNKHIRAFTNAQIQLLGRDEVASHAPGLSEKEGSFEF